MYNNRDDENDLSDVDKQNQALQELLASALTEVNDNNMYYQNQQGPSQNILSSPAPLSHSSLSTVSHLAHNINDNARISEPISNEAFNKKSKEFIRYEVNNRTVNHPIPWSGSKMLELPTFGRLPSWSLLYQYGIRGNGYIYCCFNRRENYGCHSSFKSTNSTSSSFTNHLDTHHGLKKETRKL